MLEHAAVAVDEVDADAGVVEGGPELGLARAQRLLGPAALVPRRFPLVRGDGLGMRRVVGDHSSQRLPRPGWPREVSEGGWGRSSHPHEVIREDGDLLPSPLADRPGVLDPDRPLPR